ncbi:MAG TPA: hypothetical protein VGJ14_17660 [Sporichthyaceae bacterium]
MTPLPAPRTDADSYAVLDDAIAALAQRRGLNLGDELAIIHLLASLIDQALRWLPEAITTPRLNGATWNDIATLIGTSAEEAQLRFDPDSPIADHRWPWPTNPR